MKKLLLVALLLPTMCFAQKVVFEVSGSPIYQEGIITVDSAYTKDKLYTAGVEWFAKTYNNSRFVLQMQDKESGVLIGKASFSFLFTPSKTQDVDYQIKLSFKNSKLKYEISDYISPEYGLMKDGEVVKAPWVSRGLLKKYYGKTKDACLNNTNTIVSYLQQYFTKLNAKADW